LKKSFTLFSFSVLVGDIKHILLGERANVKVNNAYSHHLVPPIVNEAMAWNVGPLADCYISDDDDDWSPPADLVAFLETKHHPRRPVCVGYCSIYRLVVPRR
jgi:hypothetical protein